MAFTFLEGGAHVIRCKELAKTRGIHLGQALVMNMPHPVNIQKGSKGYELYNETDSVEAVCLFYRYFVAEPHVKRTYPKP